MLNGRMIITLVGGFSEYCEYFSKFGWKLYQQYINYQPSSNECWPSCNGITHLANARQTRLLIKAARGIIWVKYCTATDHCKTRKQFCSLLQSAMWSELGTCPEVSLQSVFPNVIHKYFQLCLYLLLVRYVALNQEQGWALTISLNTNYPDTQIRREWL